MGKRGKQDWSKDYLPVGSIRLRRRRRASGRVYEVRFIKSRFKGPNRWIPLAKHTWEKTHGPVPSGMRVVHADGNTLNDNPSNYCLMTAGEVIKLYHRLDFEMSDLNRRGPKRRAATAAHNRLRGQIRRATSFLPTRWYAIDRQARLVINEPLRSRRRLAALFGVSIQVNGAISAKRLAQSPVEFVRGRELLIEGGRNWERVTMVEFQQRRHLLKTG
jgi:hypothetical protein